MKLWRPDRVMVTHSALTHAHGRAIAQRCATAGIEVVELPGDRLVGLREGTAREVYRRAKGTLAVVVAPPSQRRLQPIPPSADWRMDIARGCPAHCQYCYLAGSLTGPPVTRAFANLDEILEEVAAHEGLGEITSAQPERAGEGTTFEASCYTDPLGIEPWTGSLARTIEHLGTRAQSSLRFTTKFDAVDPLLGLDHRGRTRARFSVNAAGVERFEGGTARVVDRLAAMGRMARAGYRVGLTIAPIMPVEDWREQYRSLLVAAGHALEGVEGHDLTVELITHRFTQSSKATLADWYPSTALDMDEETRTLKRTKFRGQKWVYPKDVMRELRSFFETEVPVQLPGARILYFT